MPKRKRSVADTVQNKLEKYRIDIFRALSSAKVSERKRFSTKLREPGITVAKKTRLEREYGVLKSLDLRQTARHHLHSNLLRIKAIETSEDIPEELRAEVPRPTLSPEEIALQNNVISILCSASSTRLALDRAITDICETLGVPVPTKSKRVRNKRKDTEEQPADRENEGSDEEDVKPSTGSKKKKEKERPETAEEESDSESEFEGFGSDADEPRPTIEALEGSDQETAVTKYDGLLGGSSDESEDEFDEEFLAKYRGTERVNLDDISVSGSGSEAEDEDEDEDDLESISGSRSPSPLPTKKPKKLTDDDDDDDEPKPETTKSKKERKEEDKKKRAAKAALKTARPGDSTFLPTLMGGYISGSESASDIDAPPKKRRGQRARQAIWEKKYGTKAKHLQKEAANGGRDSGWDMKRGAVGAEDQGRKPWKKGSRAPAGSGGRGGYSQGRGGANAYQESRPAPPPKPVKKDNEGPLHPSWEARKKAKELQKGAAFAGSKIVFD
ncbi:hypothetical protein ACHAPX_003878 [Trichoderma viride]